MNENCPDQIAAEAADGIYERYINQKMWTKSGTLTQGEFLAMMRERIQSAIEKAKRADSEAVAKELDEHLATQGRAAHASEQLEGGDAACLTCQPQVDQSNAAATVQSAAAAARASEPLGQGDQVISGDTELTRCRKACQEQAQIIAELHQKLATRPGFPKQPRASEGVKEKFGKR